MTQPQRGPTATSPANKGASSTADTGVNLYRREPRQARSREMTERILRATIEHLEEEGGRTLTTNHIARRAGVDIASLYRYYGSKEAILVELTERWIAGIQAIHDRHLERMLNGMPLLAMLRSVTHDIEHMPEGRWAYQELAYLMETLPPLRALEDAHSARIVDFWAKALQHHGSDWPLQRLRVLSRLFYVQIDAALMLAAQLPAAEAADVRRWHGRAVVRLLRQALPRRHLKPGSPPRQGFC
ncbi:TetR/AcrR family transcriptional regulator [Hydrogenophaga defluvii]|uniref:TetR/AcrR family transcriptional regulator n=1 Tax=Hydrogenophaga defluvii TaxID=249410 RepID=A0ABW2S946_9BURK